MKSDIAFIRMNYVNIVLSAAFEQFQLEPNDLGIPNALYKDPMALVPMGDYLAWLEQLSVQCGENYLGDIAQSLNLSEMNMPADWFMSAPDFAISLRRINYGITAFQSGASYYVIQSGRIIKWCYNTRYAKGLQRSYDSLRVALMLVNTMRHYLGVDFSPHKVHLSGPAMSHLQLEKLFNCPVVYNTKQTEIWADNTVLLQSKQMQGLHDPTLQMPLSLFEKYINMPQPDDVPKILYELVNFSRYYGLPSITDVAGKLGLSKQQLQRRLQEKGFSFIYLRGYVLSNQAVKYMLEGKQIEEISQLLGYGNKQSFTKAFKTFRLCTPQQYLQRLQGQQHPAD
ncbi:AraC family transcriptional regulator [Shewanella sp. Scap07]|uniref:AraC family transcriptional regulator n=1 Tax=Shewanella sp. Scap07 TaxID=2589987 RepID=UPI0015BE00A7|nr:AraC family transcriptional regulator [Shewanella sp. Scap07]QLE87390.1 AraC family transcriptional regulator [Shewanella sp. Scap07]